MPESPLTVLTIPLDQVRPDPKQPRRLLPEELAEKLIQGRSPSDILVELRARAQRNRWLKEKLAELDGLANSIAADGLMEPIRVYRESENQYRIEAGERRWWAHQILVGRGRQEFAEIAALLVTTSSEDKNLLRRRVAENVHRTGFTAIELAQAMSQRVKEILSNEPGTKRRDAERRVGLENQMSDRRVRQYVALLSLSPEVKEFAQQSRLTENALRALLGLKDAARQLERARQLADPAKPAHHPRARSETPKRKKNPNRGEMLSKCRMTKARVSSKAGQVHQNSAPAQSARSGQRTEIIKSMDDIITAGHLLHGTLLSEAERRYWHEQLRDEVVSGHVSQLVNLLNDAKPPMVRIQSSKSTDADGTE